MANLFNTEERKDIIDLYYKERKNPEIFQIAFNEQLKLKRYGEDKEKDSNFNEMGRDIDDNISFDTLVDDFEQYIRNPMSGKARNSDSTNENTISNLRTVIDDFGIFHLDHFVKNDFSMELAKRLESRQVQDTTRYSYALAVKSFLEFCKQREDFDADFHRKVDFGLVRWEAARKNYQKGLTTQRAINKKREIVAREKQVYPKISEVAALETYYKKKLCPISRKNYSKVNLGNFYIWLTFYLSRANALRPSSIGNMKLRELNDAFKRPGVRIVCVEDCKNKEDNFGYVVMSNEVYESISMYVVHWRPKCLDALKQKTIDAEKDKNLKALKKLKKMEENDYIFFTANGIKVNRFVGKISEAAWNSYRKKFCLEPKAFSLTRIRKAAQSKFEDELRQTAEEGKKIRGIFNRGIGHQ